MSQQSAVTALRVVNEAFLVSSMIERCPKTMMLRELVVNAAEAAARADGEKLVEITFRLIDGVPKLCIWNTGPGLSAFELHRICDLASSLYKENSLDGNFGMGAKVASLPSNRHGLRYRSCKAGTVNEVILCQRDGMYGRLHRHAGDDGLPAEMIDATGACRAEGHYDLSRDWTEVVLCGNHPGQNTVADPYDGNPRCEPGWLPEVLALRFFRLPPDLTLRIAPEVFGGAGPGRFETLLERCNRVGQAETVRTASGITIHYHYAPPEGVAARAAQEGLAAIDGLGCVVYKDEIYDVRSRNFWVLEGPAYGFTFAAKHCSVFIELPDDYMVRPETYRQFLRIRGGEQQQVFLAHFALLIRTHLPAWLVRIIRSHGPDQADFVNEIEGELGELLAELDVEPAFVPRPVNAPSKVPADTSKAAPKPPTKRFERPPEIIGLDSDELIAERGLKGRAAKFYPQSHQLFVNLRYPVVLALATQLEAEYATESNVAEVREAALKVASWIMTRRIARSLIYSLTKKSAGWSADEVQRTQSPESLSLVADDWSVLLEPARTRMKDALGIGEQSTASPVRETPMAAAKAA